LAEKIPLVLLGREDTGLSPAKAVCGVPLVLPNEFLQVEEFLVDQIATFFENHRYSCIFSA
jgi:hypothetical protein